MSFFIGCSVSDALIPASMLLTVLHVGLFLSLFSRRLAILPSILALREKDAGSNDATRVVLI